MADISNDGTSTMPGSVNADTSANGLFGALGESTSAPNNRSADNSEILAVYLADSETNEALAELYDGAVIDRDLIAGRETTIFAMATDRNGGVESVRLEFGDFSKLENVAPYALFGDRRGDLRGDLDLDQGEHDLTLTAYGANRGRGPVLDQIDLSFTVVAPAPEPARIQLFLADTRSDELLTQLFDGATIDRSVVDGRSLTVVAVAEDGGVESIELGFGDYSRVESVAPYALYGDFRGDLWGNGPFGEGAHAITATAYSGNHGTGDVLAEASVSFQIGDTAPPEPVVDEPVADEPVAEEPVVVAPVEPEPVADDPATDDDAGEDRQDDQGDDGSDDDAAEDDAPAPAPAEPVVVAPPVPPAPPAPAAPPAYDGTTVNFLPAFEGAVGFGANTAGGRGGEIVKVTNLNDSGAGSLRWALEDLSGPRIVVFDVGGVIKLREEIEVNGQVTVAGQTAPGEGVQIEGARIRVVESDVIIRGLKIRPGEEPGGQEAENRDAISVGKRGETVERVIVDSNSFAWALDETAAVWGGATDVTYSNNIIAEGLELPSRPPSFGLLVGDDAERITISGNLFAHNKHRNPQVKDATEVEVVNNLIYNYGDNGLQLGDSTTANVVGNVFLAGANSVNREPVRLLANDRSEVFLEDNWGPFRESRSEDESAIASSSNSHRVMDHATFTSSGVATMDGSEVADYVLANVGARGQGLDAVDARIINDVINGTGRVISSTDEVPFFAPETTHDALSDRDNDGIADEYEALIGTDADVFDAHGDVDGDGYTNIEEYINGLLDGFDQTPANPSPFVAPQSGLRTQDTGVVTALEEATTMFRVEAEDLDLVDGFIVNTNPHASGNGLIRMGDNGRQRADLDFEGANGRYDIAVEHFDETDGVSQLAIEVNGVEVDSWTWDQQLGSRFVDQQSATTHVAEDVALRTGDTVSLVGYGDGNEPLRIDALEFVWV